MTSPTGPTTPPAPTTTPRVDADAREPMRVALGAAHAACWAYGLAGAFLGDAADAVVNAGLTDHRARRDATDRLLRDAGADPVAAEPSYTPPTPVTDKVTAARLLVNAETDVAAAWHSVLEHTDDQGLRTTALDNLTAAAVRAVRWRAEAGATPTTVPLPGVPTG